jgi:3-oxoacyl-[acyl-carrier protein] reductase
MQLKGAVCIVTGSATGIGAECALALAKKGCHSVINYTKSVEEAQAVAKQCTELGAEALLVQANVAHDADCRRLAQSALQRWGRIDALVNNAGTTKVALNHSDLDALSAEDFQRIYSVNVVGAYQMICAVAPAMRKQGRGAIVNVSSRAGVDGVGTSVAYVASKGALNTMTMALARALGPEIRVNAVCPGFVETRWLREAIGERYDAARQRYAENSPLQKTCTAADVAEVVTWLLEGAELVTGELILIDGGNRLGAARR